MIVNVQTITKFELLPNEILIECFEYLNVVEMFHSLDQLNYRFNKLIRYTQSHLDFRNIQKLTCDHFCGKMLSEQDIKKQIYSLHLANKNTYYPIQSFISLFPLDEFVHLRSLTLTNVTRNNLKQLKPKLSLLIELRSFRMIESEDKQNEIFSALPMSQLQTLMVPHLPQDLKLIYQFSSITKLTISRCTFYELYQILSNSSKLHYLKVRFVSENKCNMQTENVRFPSNLEKLIIMRFYGTFDDLVIILNQTPNLKSLTINVNYQIDTIDADQWEQFIISSLPHLTIFRFKFECYHNDQKDDIHEIFKQFQSDFWCRQHHWYTEYSLSKHSASIYTIPSLLVTYLLMSPTNRYCNESMNKTDVFNNVKNSIIVYPDIITKQCEYHFSSVTSLILGHPSPFIDSSLLGLKHIKHLKMVVNLCNIKHLSIASCCKLETPFLLIELLKEARQLTSLSIDPNILLSLFNDDESCKYLNNMIKTLDICMYDIDSLIRFDKMNQFCKVFSNIEQFKCTINQRTFLFFLLKHLSKLSYMNIYSEKSTFRDELTQLEEELQKLDIKIITEFYDETFTNLFIWISRDLH